MTNNEDLTQQESAEEIKKDCGCGDPNCSCGDNCTCTEENNCGCDCWKEKKDCGCGDLNCDCGDDCKCTPEDNCGCDCNNENKCDCKQDKCECEENDCHCSRQDDITETKQASDEYFEHLLKLQAEFDNYRKRTEKDVMHAYNNGRIDAIAEFLPALDSFKMATEYIQDKNTLIGIEYIEKGILNILEKMGVKVIDTNVKFDPNLHQAIGSEEMEGYESGDIIKECFKGFIMGDKVIRYSQVIVKK